MDLKHCDMKTFSFDLNGFEESRVIGESSSILSELYQRRIDGQQIVVKTIQFSDLIEDWQVEGKIVNLMNLRHPLIASPIGFTFGVGSNKCRELKVIRLYAEHGTLCDMLSRSESCTPTAKAKIVVGIALCLRFAHSFGMIHGGLKSSNIVFDADERVQLADFSWFGLSGFEIGGFSGDEWNPSIDVYGFALILLEIVVGCRVLESNVGDWLTMIPPNIPGFVFEIIEDGLSRESSKGRSFIDIVASLKANDFQILPSVDSDEIFSFVNLIEKFEEGDELD